MEMFLLATISGVMTGVIYALVAVGFVLIYKCSGIFNFAHGALVLLGAYVCWSFLYELGLPVWLGILLALIAAAIFGLLIERLVLRPLIGESILALVMVTIALNELIRGGVTTFWGSLDLEFVKIFPAGAVTLGGIILSRAHLIGAAMAAALLAAFVLFFRYSRWGLAMRGVAEGHQVARSMGISVKSIIGLSWAIAAMVATLAGVLQGSIAGFQIQMWEIILIPVAAAIIGGLDSIPGAVVASLLIGVLEKIVSTYLGYGAGVPASFMIMVVLLFFRPYGFWGLKRIERV
ncbi:MAG: branched-chain amino acid ABC transporter permease [Dehalococcoidia bacterium]